MKLSPGSDPIDLTKIMMFVTTQYGETPYQFDNQHLLLLHQDIRLDQLYDPSEGRAPKVDDPRPEHPEGDGVIVKVVPQMGQIMSMEFTVPDSLGNQFVTFS